MHRPLDPDTIGVPNTGYDGRPAPTSRKPLTTGDHWLWWLPNLWSSQAIPLRDDGRRRGQGYDLCSWLSFTGTARTCSSASKSRCSQRQSAFRYRDGWKADECDSHSADDSALRECDESRGTRYSECHSGPLRRRRPAPTKRSLMLD